MGADFICSVVWLPEVDDPWAELRRRAKLLTREEMDSASRVMWGISVDEYYPNENAFTQALLEAIDEIEDNRAVAMIHAPPGKRICGAPEDGRKALITGGMSSGDYPSDAWEAMLMVEYSSIDGWWDEKWSTR